MKQLFIIIGMVVAAMNMQAQTVIPLSAQEAALTGYNTKIVVEYDDVAAVAGTGTNATVRIYPPVSGAMGSNVVVAGCAVVLETPFTNASGAQQTALGLQVGDAGSATRYISTVTSVGPTNTIYGAAVNTLRFETTSTNYLTATFLGTNANGSVALTNLAAGKASIFLRIVPLEGK